MTNPNNAVGTNAAYGGRTSVNAFNDDLAVYSRGVMSGWACSPSSGLTVSLGGDGTARDVAVAEDNAGNKVTINNISGSPVSVTLAAAPGSNSRIDAIVAYVDNPPQGSSTIADNYEACGLIAVSGSASSSPVPPNDSAIRTAITADGASGATAYYVVLATVNLASGTTDIVETDITAGTSANISNDNIPPITADMLPLITSSKIDWATILPQTTGVEIDTGIKFGNAPIYAQKFSGTFTNSTSARVAVNLLNSGVSMPIGCIGAWAPNSTSPRRPLGAMTSTAGGVQFDSFATIDSTSAGVLRFMVNSSAYNNTTGSYDLIVFYLKS